MAIFGKNRAQQGPGNGATIVAAGTELVGNLTLSDRLHVDGRVEGDIDSESGVVIGAAGHLKGTVKARDVVVSGRIEGSVSAQRLEIIAGGNVEGDVHTVNLVIEPGGRFNGSSEILAEDQQPAETARPASGNVAAGSGGKDRKAQEESTPTTGQDSGARPASNG